MILQLVELDKVLEKVTQQFDSVNKLGEESGGHPRRTVQLDMEKLLTQLQNDNVFGYVHGRKHSKFKKIQTSMWMKEHVQKYKMYYI